MAPSAAAAGDVRVVPTADIAEKARARPMPAKAF
jgi:hypothetical protein